MAASLRSLEPLHRHGAYFRRPRQRFALYAVEMHGRHLTGCRRLARLRIAQAMKETHGLGAQLEQRGIDLDQVSSEEFLPVGDVLLYGSHAAAGLPQVA